MHTLKHLLQGITVQKVIGNLETLIQGVYYDSRLVEPGGLFVAISGFQTDGHSYVPQAIQRGATALLVERAVEGQPGIAVVQVANTRAALAPVAAAFYDSPDQSLQVIGITGTNGKTTTTYLVQAVLQEAGRSTGVIGTLGASVGSERLPLERTTPEASDLQALLARIVKAGGQYAVMEVSSHALELHRVDALRFKGGVFTNLTQDHLDFHGNWQSYLDAKARLFASLDQEGYAVFNADDPHWEQLAAVTRARVITYGVQQLATVRATQVRLQPQGLELELATPVGRFDVRLALTGMFNVYNALAAITVALEEGIPPELLKRSLAKVAGVAGRFEVVASEQDYTVVVDYAHTPDGLDNVLKAARQLSQGQVIVVFGCGGDRDRIKRPRMGAVAARLGDQVLVTSDNPRSEDPEAIIADILPGILQHRQDGYQVVVDRREAIGRALDLAQTGDVVVIAGKGHETYQIIGNQVLPFDDREVVRNFLGGDAK